jgi:uncharacterized protein (DUF983 family)
MIQPIAVEGSMPIKAARKPILSSLWRGLKRQCPNCGQGRLFAGYLKVQETCTVCGHDNEQYPADDAAPYFTIFVTGHILVPLALVVDQHWAAATTTIELAIFLPATLFLSLLLLPYIKGGVLGVAYAMNVVREKPVVS